MLDTVKIRSPELSAELVIAIETACYKHQSIECATGDIQYSITTGQLVGSFDHHVSVRIEDPKVEYEQGLFTMLPGATIRPRLLIEGSVHKAMLGHNIHGGPGNNDMVKACAWLVADVGRRLGVVLPSAALWQVRRVDVVESFDLGSFEAVRDYIDAMVFARYPRRKTLRYASETVMFVGRNSSLKFYHKGVEFERHDKRRLSRHIESGLLDTLAALAMGVLRVENSIKAKKLDEDFEGPPLINRVDGDYLNRCYLSEVVRVIREGSSDMQIIRTAKAVRTQLHNIYSDRLAERLFGAWLDFSSLGEDYAKRNLPARTFYRLRSQLAGAGVGWIDTDVQLVESQNKASGFVPVLLDHRRLVGQADIVRDFLLAA